MNVLETSAIDKWLIGLSGNIFDVYLKPYFLEGTRKLHARFECCRLIYP
jgi:hypothetical protein